MNKGWEHPLDASEGWEGLNDGDMEHFVNDPIVKAAREGIQNSLDAKRMIQAGANGLLVGESIMRSSDRSKIIKEISSNE